MDARRFPSSKRGTAETREEASIVKIEGLFVACEMLETMCVVATEGRVSLPQQRFADLDARGILGELSLQ